MKYAKEIIDLMSAYPGRYFRMAELVRLIGGKRPAPDVRQAIRVGIRRVLVELSTAGFIEIGNPKRGRGGLATYRWKEAQVVDSSGKSAKVIHANLESDRKAATLGVG